MTTLIIASRYHRAVLVARIRGLADSEWTWLCSESVADAFERRCRERGLGGPFRRVRVGRWGEPARDVRT